MTTNTKPLWILIAGPYRSGTNDNPELIEKNIKAMNETALKVLHKGHMPVLGEWFALPLIKEAGSKEIGDEIFNKIFHPIAIRLGEKLDAVLRIGGASSGADEMVRQAEKRGQLVFRSLKEVPELKESLAN
jgi:GDP-mannose pyrophosphatase NudK